MAATGKCHPGGEVLWRRDVPRSLHPESAGTGSGRCRRRQAVARGRPAFPSARTPPGSSGGRSSGRYAGFAGLKVCTELPDSFFRMKEEAGAGWGLIQGKRVAGKPPENRRQNRWKTAGDHWQNRWKTAGRPLAKLSENRRKTVGKTAGRPLAKLSENRRKTVGKTAGRPLAKPSENRWETAVELAEKTAGKPPENRRKSPVFG